MSKTIFHEDLKFASGHFFENFGVAPVPVDPTTIYPGLIWYNSSENVYKNVIDMGNNGLQIQNFGNTEYRLNGVIIGSNNILNLNNTTDVSFNLLENPITRVLDLSISISTTGLLSKPLIGFSSYIAPGVITTSDSILTAIQKLNSNISTKANTNSPTFTGTVSGITKAMIGLSNVDNTSDANKPMSTIVSNAIASTAATTLATSTAYADNVILSIRGPHILFDASVNYYPIADVIPANSKYMINVVATDGPLVGKPIGTCLRAIVNNPGQNSIYWQVTDPFAFTTSKDDYNGFAGLSNYKLNLKNNLGTITSYLNNNNTSSRLYTLPDKDMTIAGLDDINGQFNSTISHHGLDFTQGTNVDQLMVYTINLLITTDWEDVYLPIPLVTGSYIIQLFANDISNGGTNSNEYYTGCLSWYSELTNSSMSLPSDEIVLHRAGGSGEGSLYLRTYRENGQYLKLQIYSNTANSTPANYIFKFRRVI